MKNLKLKLMSAIAMLMVATIGLASVSFAWFTISTNPEVSQMKMNVAANENLEIALDNGYTQETDVDTASNNDDAGGVQGSTAGNPYTWGNLINLDYGFNTASLSPSTKTVAESLYLKPVKYDETAGLNYPNYADDGRITELTALTEKNVKAYASLDDDLAGGLKVYSEGALSTTNMNLDAFSVTYWLRSNMDANVSLSATGVKRANSSEDTADGAADDYANLYEDVNQVIGSGSFIELPESAEDLVKDGKLVIQFDVVDAEGNKNTYYAQTSTATNGKYALKLTTKSGTTYTDATIALTANEAKKVTMYVYINGETITNADAFLDDITDIGLNIQFTDTKLDADNNININDAMDVGAASGN